LVGDRYRLGAADLELAFANHVHQLDSKLSMGLITRLVARLSCSTMLLTRERLCHKTGAILEARCLGKSEFPLAMATQ